MSQMRPVARPCAPHHSGRDNKRLSRLSGSDSSQCLPGLDGHWRAISKATDEHGHPEAQQDAKRVHLKNADIGRRRKG